MSDEWNIIDIESGNFRNFENEKEQPLLEFHNIYNSFNNKPQTTIDNKTLFKSMHKKRERSSSVGSQRRVNYVISEFCMIEQKRNKRLKINNDKFVRIRYNQINRKRKLKTKSIKTIKSIKYLFFVFIIIFVSLQYFLFIYGNNTN